MKLLVRCSAALGMVGSILLGGVPGMGNFQAQALPDEQVAKKLSSVPVFMIGIDEGRFLSLCFEPPTDKNQPPKEIPCPGDAQNAAQKKVVRVTPAFISYQDAQTNLQQLRQARPSDTSNLKVIPRSLWYAYRVEQTTKNQPNPVLVDFLPAQQQVNSAVTLLRQSGQSVPQYNGVPLFVAVTTVGQEKRYVPGREGNEEVIPLFFDKEQLQTQLEELKKKNPQLFSKVEIQVIDLEAVLEGLRSSNESVFNKFRIYPSTEAVKFLQSLPPAQQRPQQQQQQRPQQQRPQQRPQQQR